MLNIFSITSKYICRKSKLISWWFLSDNSFLYKIIWARLEKYSYQLAQSIKCRLPIITFGMESASHALSKHYSHDAALKWELALGISLRPLAASDAQINSTIFSGNDYTAFCPLPVFSVHLYKANIVLSYLQNSMCNHTIKYFLSNKSILFNDTLSMSDN